MINDVIVRVQDAFMDQRGDLYTIWEEGDFNLKFNHDKVSVSKKMFYEEFMETINLGN